MDMVSNREPENGNIPSEACPALLAPHRKTTSPRFSRRDFPLDILFPTSHSGGMHDFAPIIDGEYVYARSWRWGCLILVKAPDGEAVVGDRSGAEPAEAPRRRPVLGLSLNPAVRRRFKLDSLRCPCGHLMEGAEFERALAAPTISICDACRAKDAPVFPSPHLTAPAPRR